MLRYFQSVNKKLISKNVMKSWDQFSSVQSLVRPGHRYNIKDDSAEILFQSFLFSFSIDTVMREIGFSIKKEKFKLYGVINAYFLHLFCI